jgi:flagellar assembly factor FliW
MSAADMFCASRYARGVPVAARKTGKSWSDIAKSYDRHNLLKRFREENARIAWPTQRRNVPKLPVENMQKPPKHSPLFITTCASELFLLSHVYFAYRYTLRVLPSSRMDACRRTAMEIVSRFGPLVIDTADVIHFPTGLVGMESCRRWALLADQQSNAIAWLQSVDRPEVAFAVTSPRRFVPDYQMRVARRELALLRLDDLRAAKVLVIVGRTARGLSLNLKAPLVLNLQRRLGRQVVTNGELPIRFEVGSPHTAARRIA